MKSPIDIFRYIDYRHYLADLFDAFKKEGSSFSYRSFARLAGSTSPNFLQLITARKLNISQSQLQALARSLSLAKKEESFFETIVSFDHAKTHDEKETYYRRMLLTREYSAIAQLEKAQYVYFSRWYLPVIRELVIHPGYRGDPVWIAERIVPTVSISKITRGIALLESLGLIKKEGDRYQQVSAALATPSEVMSLAVTQYHKDAIMLGREAIERFGSEQRDIRAVTLGIDKEGYAEVKRRLELFWKELLAFAETQKTPRRVVQVNMQLFPLSTTGEEQ